MPIKYNSIVPWGRNLSEYKAMFSLTEKEMKKKILSCGDGPASFNSEMTKMGNSVTSFDPVYQFTKEQLLQRIDETYEAVMEQTRENKEKFIWTHYKNAEELGKVRMETMKQFLLDFEAGKSEKRYITGELPVLPFKDKVFDLALSSHFLFLYSQELGYEFHLKSISEMLRVAKEVRLFPLLDLNANRSIHLDKIIDNLQLLKHSVSEETVNYEFQKGGNKMLKIISE